MEEVEQCGGKRGKLKTKLETIEFYCLTCKDKRKIRTAKNIEITMTKNNRPIAKAQCNAKQCTRKLAKFLSNEEAEQVKNLTTSKTPVKKVPKKKISKN